MIRRFARLAASASHGALLGAVLVCMAAPLSARQLAPGAAPGAPVGSASYAVVQSTTPSPTRMLNAALARLARDPRDMGALIDAGSAALDLGDADAAIGFFTRAEEVSPGNGGVRARIGMAMLRSNQPFEAIRSFDLADQAGFPRAEMATERGLAYDLVGDNAAAQRQYQLALAGGPNDEASRRYALSLVIAGDRRGAEGVIQPLLTRSDRGAWRVRTFIMAIAGQTDEAVGIANATMPADLAAAIAPYLRYMSRLTPAQQAAAANLGRFPRAADIGRDDPQIVQYAALHPRAPRVDAGLVPAGAALGGKGRDDRDSRAKRRRPGRENGRETVVATVSPAAVPPAVSAPWGLQPGGGSPTMSAPAVASNPNPAPAVAPLMTPPAARPGAAPVVLSRLDVPPGTPLAPAPAPRPAIVPAPSASASLVPSPAPVPVLLAAQTPQPTAPASTSAPASASASTFAPAPAPGAAVSGPAYALLASPEPAPQTAKALQSATVPAAVPTPLSAPLADAPVAQAPTASTSTAITPIPNTAPATLPTAVPSSAAPADFRSMFDGFTPPEREAVPTAEAVDLARIEALRQEAAAKVKEKAKDKDRAKVKDRGDRPDGPTAVSRSSDDDAVGPAARSAKDKAAKTKAEADKAAKEKASLEKACADSKSGKDKKGKSAAGKSAKGKNAKTGKSAKDPVCPAETDKDKKGKNGKAQPAHASRIWVQVLTGANRDMMGREWQRLAREAAVLKGRRPFITPWRSNFRLLTGPFDSDAEAQAFIDRLRKDGVSGFEWTSPAGQAVDGLQIK